MKRNLLRIIAAILLVCSLIGTCSSCDLLDSILGKNKDEGEGTPKADLVIFENGKYNCEFVYPTWSDASVSELRNELRAAFKAKTGINPSFAGDEKSKANAEVFEVLLGNTNRPESAAPAGVTEGTDAYYSVSVVGNKLVINGSDSYQIGVAIDYFVENYLSGDVAEKVAVSGDLSEVKILKDYTRENWKLGGIPAYSQAGENKLIAAVYKSGTTIMGRSASNNDKSDVSLQRIEKTTDAEFEAYLAKLDSFGFEKEYENIAAEVTFLTYTKGDVRFHVAYKPAIREVQVIDDPNGISVEEFGYTYTPEAGERSEYYLYGLPMTDGKGKEGNMAPNCGTLSVIKCADNSVIIIDGGDYEGEGGLKQMYGKEVMDAFDDFLHEITGTADGDKVRISAWYVSHYHSDHTKGLLEFFKGYHASYELERVIANIPVESCGGSSNPFGSSMTSWVYRILDDWCDLIKVRFPNCKEMKVHAGQKIQIADVSLEILYTHEDLLNGNNRFKSADSNDTSTVTRFDNGQMSMISLGDAGRTTETRLRQTYTELSLRSDVIQPAHHLINDVFDIYEEIQPDFALVPQSYECSQSKTKVGEEGTYIYRYNKLIALVDKDNCYFAGNETVGLAVVNGQIQVVYHNVQRAYP